MERRVFVYQEVKQLADMLTGSSKTVALTGAGISTESGIPDFRSPGGLWSKVDPDIAFSRDTFIYRPEVFYQSGFQHLHAMTGAEPNKAHRVLARMQAVGLLHGIITQNVDSLHQKAGSTNVLELHGHLRSATCMKCSNKINWDQLVELVLGGRIPARCECRGVYKPDAVFFGDELPVDFEHSIKESRSSELMLVIGSSLEVAPANFLPQMSRRVVIINLDPTDMDGQVDLVIHGKCGEVFAALEEKLQSRGLLR